MCWCMQVKKYESYLKHDDLISHNLELLYDKMLESNMLKIIHPYRYIHAYISIFI